MTLFYSDIKRSRALATLEDDPQQMTSHHMRRITIDEVTSKFDRGYLSWIRILFTLTNSDLEQKAGLDAVHFLRFYTYLIIYTGITTVLCLVVILPLNINGVLKSRDLQQFGVTTISNIPDDSWMLWFHMLFGLVFFVIAFSLMTNFARRLRADSRRNSSFDHVKTTPKKRIQIDPDDVSEKRVIELIENTLMVSGVSRSNCKKDLVAEHFAEAYPDCSVVDIQIAYDVRRLLNLDLELQSAISALEYSRCKTELCGHQPVILPIFCGATCLSCRRCCGGCCGSFTLTSPPRDVKSTLSDSNISEQQQSHGEAGDEDGDVRSRCQHCCNEPNGCNCCVVACCSRPVEDAVVFYTKTVLSLNNEMEREREKALNCPIGIVFVTFASAMQAYSVLRSYRLARCGRRPNSSARSKQLRSYSWTVEIAPSPNALIWQNLALKRTIWWIRAALLNVSVFLVAFFLTTPLYVLNLVSSLQLTKYLPIQGQYLKVFPSIVLWAASVLLPYMIVHSDILIKHWTKTTLHFVTMAKTVAMLLLMVLILPSLGLTSVPALLEWLFPIVSPSDIAPSNLSVTVKLTNSKSDMSNATAAFRWECVFMPDNGAFFVNYVITACFIGSAFELARLPELIAYAFRLLVLRSRAEKLAVEKAVLAEFDFGLNYAWLLCVFAVITTYSILCPLITPIGFLCLILRYLVARYNLYFAYLPSRIDMRLHWLATSLMLFCVLMLQINVSMFIALRFRRVSLALFVCTLFSFTISSIWFFAAVAAGWVYIGAEGCCGGRRPTVPAPMSIHTAEHVDGPPVSGGVPGGTSAALVDQTLSESGDTFTAAVLEQPKQFSLEQSTSVTRDNSMSRISLPMGPADMQETTGHQTTRPQSAAEYSTLAKTDFVPPVLNLNDLTKQSTSSISLDSK